MGAVEIVPVAQGHIESFHQALDIVARERRYLAFLEAPPIESTRGFIFNNIEHGYPQLVALSAGEVVGWCDVIPKPRPIYMAAFSTCAFCRNSGGKGSASV
jgi:hypothetical protein